MNKAKMNRLKIKNIEPFEHLDIVIKTTPYQRLKWLETAWDFWHKIQKSKEIMGINEKH